MMKRRAYEAIVIGAIALLTVLLGVLGFLSRHKVSGVDFSTINIVAIYGCLTGIVLLVAASWVVGLLWRSVEEVRDGLADAADEISSLAIRFSGASTQISQNSMEQAAQMEQVASSINQVNDQAKDNADKTVSLNKLSRESKEYAENGSQTISEMFGAIVAIDESSGRASKVIKTIRDIAFQTNILALNAAVEAARAGESGRGFAVVAAEVRNLAGHTSEAAQDSTKMIQDNAENAKAAIQISTKVGELLMGIVEHTGSMAEMFEDLNAKVKDQANNFKQITTTVNECSRAIQQSVAAIEENTASSSDLAAKTAKLKDLVANLDRILSQQGEGRSSSVETLEETGSFAASSESVSSETEVA